MDTCTSFSGAGIDRNPEGGEYCDTGEVKTGQADVVIDAGHGGKDPGKVGVNDALEKDINLQIAKKLQEELESRGISVLMTREEDKGLYDEDADNKQVQDLKRRVELINETAPALAVSIHQNSYPSPDVSGSQIFYFEHSKEERKWQIRYRNR